MMQHRSGSPPLPACRAARTPSPHSSGAASATSGLPSVSVRADVLGRTIPHHMNARTYRQASTRVRIRTRGEAVMREQQASRKKQGRWSSPAA
jgi:hypothetical protein